MLRDTLCQLNNKQIFSYFYNASPACLTVLIRQLMKNRKTEEESSEGTKEVQGEIRLFHDVGNSGEL
jgi:hypothetical protein